MKMIQRLFGLTAPRYVSPVQSMSVRYIEYFLITHPSITVQGGKRRDHILYVNVLHSIKLRPPCSRCSIIKLVRDTRCCRNCNHLFHSIGCTYIFVERDEKLKFNAITSRLIRRDKTFPLNLTGDENIRTPVKLLGVIDRSYHLSRFWEWR